MIKVKSYNRALRVYARGKSNLLRNIMMQIDHTNIPHNHKLIVALNIYNQLINGRSVMSLDWRYVDGSNDSLSASVNFIKLARLSVYETVYKRMKKNTFEYYEGALYKIREGDNGN